MFIIAIPPAAFQVTAIPNSPLLTSPSNLLHSSLSSLICILPFSASSIPDTEMRRQCVQSSICRPGSPKILTVLLIRILVYFTGPGFTLLKRFSSVCIQFWSSRLRKGNREWEKVWRQAVRMPRDMGTDCTVKNCRLGLFSLEEGHMWGRGLQNHEWPREHGKD